MSNTVISIENVSKRYNLGVIGTGTFRNDLKIWWAKARNKPNPLQIVDQVDHGNREGEILWALKDISFTVEQGEAIGIIGRNGAGKSTLLKILSRVTTPTTGQIKVKGRIASLLEVGTGFHPELTGRENVFLNGAIMGMSKDEVAGKFDEIVDFSGVEQFIDTPVKRYSSGMYVRLAFAVAAHLDPDILIVDEVLAVGDLEFQKKSLGQMTKVSNDGRTVLFVSHNLGTINRLCKKTVLLDHGHLLNYDLTPRVISSYINSGKSQLTEWVQENDLRKPLALRRVRFCDSNGTLLQKPEIKYNDEIQIEIKYQVNKEISNCTVWFAIETSDGTMVFTTADFDTNPAMLKERKKGVYVSTVKIPGKWLNYGKYLAIVGLVNNQPVTVYDRVEAISFSVLEIDSPSAILQSGTRRGVLQPVINWITSKIDESD